MEEGVDAEAAALFAAFQSDACPPQLRQPLALAVETLQAALHLYGPQRLLVSFNGGKDATVLLHLARAVFAAAGHGRPRCVYWEDADAFPEVAAFVEATVARHRLPLLRYRGSFRDGLSDATGVHGCAAVLLGTRAGDPNGAGAPAFQPSSPGWPPFLRVNPLLRWAYHDVWRLLRAFALPACPLYDRGYSSLGTPANTRPNPALCAPRGAFLPPEALPSASLERGGRGPAPAPGSGSPPPFRPSVALLLLGSPLLRGAPDPRPARAAHRLRVSGAAQLAHVTASAEADGGAVLRALAARCDAVLACGAWDDHAPGRCSTAVTACAAAFGLRMQPCAALGGALLPEAATLHPPGGGVGALVALRVGSCSVLLQAPLGDAGSGGEEDEAFELFLDAATNTMNAGGGL